MDREQRKLYNDYVMCNAILKDKTFIEHGDEEKKKELEEKVQEIHSVLFSCNFPKRIYKVTCKDWRVINKKTRKMYVTASNEFIAMELAREVIGNHLHEIKWRDGNTPPMTLVDMLDADDFKVEELVPQEKGYKYYVTTYSLYSVWEKAEGGYPVECVKVYDSYAFNDRKKAIRYINKLYKELKDEPLEDRWAFHTNASNTHFGASSECYVGKGWFIQLERTYGMSAHGYSGYC